jgi:hypothetical protein
MASPFPMLLDHPQNSVKEKALTTLSYFGEFPRVGIILYFMLLFCEEKSLLIFSNYFSCGTKYSLGHFIADNYPQRKCFGESM